MTTKIGNAKNFIRYLRKHLKPRDKVIVRFKKMDKPGLMEFKEKSQLFIITINPQQSYPSMIDTIIHEWGHVLDDFPWSYREDHRDSWGIWYSRVYRMYWRWESNDRT